MANSPVKYPKPGKNRKPPVRQNDENEEESSAGGPEQPGETNWRGLALFGLCIVVLVMALYFFTNESINYKEVTVAEFDEMLDEKRVVSFTFKKNATYGEAAYFFKVAETPELAAKARKQLEERKAVPEAGNDPENTVPAGARVELTPLRAAVDRLEFDEELRQRLVAAGVKEYKNEFISNALFGILTTFLPFLVIMVVIYLLFRQQLRMAGKNAFSFGKSKARMLARDRNKITFKDVAGIEEAKEELVEIVEFLRDPRKFQKLGGRIPKGVLMIGPPGTGKTLLAKAIAGEADVPFFSISGSDFVEMFVGVGASRVRDMFEQGKKNAPCLIFIDEIDAVGRSRGTGMGGGHDEREQTLNALLVEMDGIETQEGVIIIAATNRKDVLDPALLRPGRFDREVQVHLPDVRGREAILKVHARNVKLDKQADLSLIARGSAGFSGAELANLINEAALIAAARNKDSINTPELEEARDKVRFGRERRSMAMTDEEKRTTAVHEAGHALLNILLEHTDPLHKVSIIPRGPALGVTMALPEKDKFSAWRKELIDMLCMIMGGRIAEDVFVGDISSGAAGDIKQATNIARKMVCEWGMSEKLGMIQYSDDSSMSFLGRDLGHTRSYSEKTAQEIDAEVLNLVNSAYQHAYDLITQHRDAMEKITEALLEFETLDGEHIRDIIEHGEMRNPPPKGLEGTSNPNPEEPLPANPPPEEKEDDSSILPGLEGAPARA